MSLFSSFQPREIVWSDLHTSESPAYCSYMYTYGYSQTDHVWKVSCLSTKWVWYIHAAYTTASWPAVVTLCTCLVVGMT